MEQVCDPKNLIRAYRRVRPNSNQGKPGVDRMTVHELADWLRSNHQALTDSLLEGTYQPQPVRGLQIPKPEEGQRQLGTPRRFIPTLSRRKRLPAHSAWTGRKSEENAETSGPINDRPQAPHGINAC
jgi:hypothetical protein